MTSDPHAAAVEASRHWYDRIFDLHGIPVRSDDRLWTALGDPPPWHSVVKTLSRDVDAPAVLVAMERHPHGSVADSYGVLDLDEHGFDLLIDSTWVHHVGVADPMWPPGWFIVDHPDLLAEWCRRHDYLGVLPAEVLADPEFFVLARVEDEKPVAGAVLHSAGDIAGMSNLWSSGEPMDPAAVGELLACAGVLHPGRPVTDYAYGAELEVFLASGFTPAGSQRVWAR